MVNIPSLQILEGFGVANFAIVIIGFSSFWPKETWRRKAWFLQPITEGIQGKNLSKFQGKNHKGKPLTVLLPLSSVQPACIYSPGICLEVSLPMEAGTFYTNKQ